MPRFVLLRHEMPPTAAKPSHWDLMLERAGALWTWSMEELPAAWNVALHGSDKEAAQANNPLPINSTTNSAASAARLSDHRLAYLDYEGPISGDRGKVRRIVSGTYELVFESEDRLVVGLQDCTLACRLQLQLKSWPSKTQVDATWQISVIDRATLSKPGVT